MTIQTITFDDTEWQVVPKELSADMRRIAPAYFGSDEWEALLAAAPEPPAQQPTENLPPYSAWLHVLDEAMVVRHLGVADPDDDYITAKRKLHTMFDWEIDVATDPAVGGDRVRKQPMTKTELVVALKPVLDAIFANETVPPAAWEASVRNVEQFHGIGKGESNAD